MNRQHVFESIIQHQTLYCKIFLVLLLAGILASCKTSRSVMKKPIRNEGPEYLFEQLSQRELKFDWFSAKFNIDYIYDKKKTEFKGQIRIEKDSIIWISFSPALGIEMARLIITNDSVMFLNRVDKSYFLGDYDLVNSFLETNIDFDMLQSLIIGNDFQFYEKTTFRASIDGNEYRLSTTGRNKLKKYIKKAETYPKIFLQTIWLKPEIFKISRLMIKELKKENKKLNAYYSDFRNIDKQLFATKIKFDLSAEKNIEMFVDYSRINLNKKLRFPFNIPGKYERIY